MKHRRCPAFALHREGEMAEVDWWSYTRCPVCFRSWACTWLRIRSLRYRKSPHRGRHKR